MRSPQHFTYYNFEAHDLTPLKAILHCVKFRLEYGFIYCTGHLACPMMYLSVDWTVSNLTLAFFIIFCVDSWREGVITDKNKIDVTTITVHFPGEYAVKECFFCEIKLLVCMAEQMSSLDA